MKSLVFYRHVNDSGIEFLSCDFNRNGICQFYFTDTEEKAFHFNVHDINENLLSFVAGHKLLSKVV